MSAAATSPGAACVLLRVWLPDRPGALGAVASRIGAVRGDIVGIDVLERNEGVAIDEFGVVLSDPELLPLLVREVEEVDGCRVEHVMVVTHFPDPRLDALISVALVCEAADAAALQQALATYAGTAFRADWVAVMAADRVLASYGNPPADDYLVALASGAASSPAVVAGLAGPADLATAPLAGRGAGRSATDLVGRIDALAAVAGRLGPDASVILGIDDTGGSGPDPGPAISGPGRPGPVPVAADLLAAVALALLEDLGRPATR